MSLFLNTSEKTARAREALFSPWSWKTKTKCSRACGAESPEYGSLAQVNRGGEGVGEGGGRRTQVGAGNKPQWDIPIHI